MSDSTPRSRRREKTHSRILDAARGCVGRGGIDALTLGAVAAELDLTAAALYRYFPNKGALLAAVNAQVLEEQRAIVVRIGDLSAFRGRPDPLVRLLAVVHALLLLAERQPDDFALLVATLADPRTLVDDPVHAVHMPELLGLLVDLSGWVADAQTAGQLTPGPADIRAMSLVFATLGALQTRKLTRFYPPLDSEGLAVQTARDLVLGWGADFSQLDARVEAAAQTARRATMETVS